MSIVFFGVVSLLLLWHGGEARTFGKCELASHLLVDHNMPRERVKTWVCIAEFESTFNTSAINTGNWDGSSDHGLFQLSNKFWCRDPNWSGPAVCGIPCSDLLDDDIADDLRCVDVIIKGTESWKGKGTGLTAWVAYVNRCQNRDLNAYIAECSADLDKAEAQMRKPGQALSDGPALQDIRQVSGSEKDPAAGEPQNVVVEEDNGKDITNDENILGSNVEKDKPDPFGDDLQKLPGQQHVRSFDWIRMPYASILYPTVFPNPMLVHTAKGKNHVVEPMFNKAKSEPIKNKAFTTKESPAFYTNPVQRSTTISNPSLAYTPLQVFYHNMSPLPYIPVFQVGLKQVHAVRT